MIYDADEKDVVVTIHEAKTELVSSTDMFGKVTSGQLKLSGRLCQVVITTRDDYLDEYACPYYELGVITSIDAPPVSVEGYVHKDSTFDGQGYVKGPIENVYFMPIRNRSSAMDGILIEVAEDGNGVFQRIGMFTVRKEVDLATFEKAFNTFEILKSGLGPEYYETGVEDGKYTITII